MVENMKSNFQYSNSNLLSHAVLGVVFVFAIFAWILWRLGLFSFSGTQQSANIVAASISLVGGLIGSLVTIIGIILKHSLDLRSFALKMETETREKIESDRNNRLADEAEKRLNSEATIQALGLLSTNSGQETSDIQKAGIILILSHLGKMDIALSLSDKMLTEKTLDAGTATWLFNKALTSHDHDIQQQAAILTDYHILKLLADNGGAEFPAILVDPVGFTSLNLDTQRVAVFAIIDLLMLRSYSEWKPDDFLIVLKQIHYIWKNDSDDKVKTNAGIALSMFIQAYKPEKTIDWDSGSQSISELTKELADYAEQSLHGELFDRRSRSLVIEEWAKEARRTRVD